MKLYKYRPLSEFLFKELYYQELYFASYFELNDPLDLSARIDFTPESENQISYLLWFIFKTTIRFDFENLTEEHKSNNKALLLFQKDKQARKKIKKIIFENLQKIKCEESIITIDDLESILINSSKELDFNPDIQKLKSEINRLTSKFLANSYTTCFSEINNDFLMWSHYASKHSGVCLEFDLQTGQFPYKMTGKRKPDKEKYKEKMSIWNIEEHIFYDRIKKVFYTNEQPHINFFDFYPVFDNEYDCDLIGLSKSWTHGFAYELENVFSTKTFPYKYENEWRAIEINFGESKEPEERIRHYPIECLSAVYFGCNTPEAVRKRIFKLYDNLHSGVKFYKAILKNGNSIDFEECEFGE